MEAKKSMLEVANEIITKAGKGVKFSKLWEEVCSTLGISEEEANSKISMFYTQLTTSGSIVQEKENVWNLASKVSYDKSHINIEDAEDEVEEVEDIDEDEAAFNASIEQQNVNRDEENIDGQTEDEEEKTEQENKLSDFIK